MSESITFNNATYIIPDPGESGWGQNLTNYFVAIASGCYQLSGGTNPLTADLSFGTNFGILSKYFKSTSSNIAAAGVVRLANTDTIDWRNAANNANLALSVDSSNNLLWNGDIISTSSASPVLSIAGTANEITASAATGNVALSIPSSFIAPGSIAATSTLSGTTGTFSASTNQIVLGTTRTLTLTSPEPATSSRTLTLPDPGGSDSVAYLALAQTLTNKTIAGGSNTISGISLTASVTGVLPIVNGGTNSSTSLGNGAVMVSSGGAIIESSGLKNSAAGLAFVSAATYGIVGTGGADNAASGNVGEYVFSTVAQGSSVSAGTSGNWGDVTNITLTAGDWDIDGCVGFQANGSTTTYIQWGVGTGSGTSNSGLAYGDTQGSFSPMVLNSVDTAMPCPPGIRVSLSGSTTFYLKAQLGYSVATPKIYGRISARRRR